LATSPIFQIWSFIIIALLLLGSSSIQNITSLSVLDPNTNQLSGIISDRLGNLVRTFLWQAPFCTVVVVKEKGKKLLDGVIPIAITNFSILTILDLFENSLTGIIPPSMGFLRSLEQISFRRNGLHGGISPGLSSLINLSLRLSVHVC
jgi:hypothetical protein